MVVDLLGVRRGGLAKRSQAVPMMYQQHWRDHNLCIHRVSDRRMGEFVARVFTCVICGREEREFVYRPRWWRRLFQREAPAPMMRREPALFEAWGK